MIDRRALLLALGALPAARGLPDADKRAQVRAIERPRVLAQAGPMLGEPPRTIVAVHAARSPAGPHDYYSEGDYWWPDPANPAGPYVRRDGRSNPAKFDGHRDALIRFGRIVPALAAAWLLTRDARYAQAACRHLRAWFVDPSTRMNPNLAHAQAIIGVNTGRAIGIIDTLQIVEVARAATLFARLGAPGYRAIRPQVERWFADYLDWLTTSPAGQEERRQKNNHGTCWLLQAAAFAIAAQRPAILAQLRQDLLGTIVPTQVAADGRQPLELARTKPFGYSLFNLDVLAAAAWLLAPEGGLIGRRAGDGSIAKAIGFMAPFLADKSQWPFARDVEYFDDWPVRHPSLLFGAMALGRDDWFTLWQRLDAEPKAAEVIRNYPVRQPLLWL